MNVRVYTFEACCFASWQRANRYMVWEWWVQAWGKPQRRWERKDREGATGFGKQQWWRCDRLENWSRKYRLTCTVIVTIGSYNCRCDCKILYILIKQINWWSLVRLKCKVREICYIICIVTLLTFFQHLINLNVWYNTFMCSMYSKWLFHLQLTD